MKTRFLALVVSLISACVAEDRVPEPLAAPRDTVVAHVVGRIAPADHEFGKLTNIAFGPNGEVVAADGVLHQVVIFDSTGDFLRSFGRSGDGPGEMNGPEGVWVFEDGEIAVLSNSYTRVTFFSWEGELLRRSQMVMAGRYGGWTGAFGDKETLYERIIVPGGPRDTDLLAANQFGKIDLNPDGVAFPETLAQVPYHSSGEIVWTMDDGRENRVGNPLGYNALMSIGPEGTLASLSQDSLSIFVRAPTGETLLELPMPPSSSLPMAAATEVQLAREYLEDLLADAKYRMPEVPATRILPYSMLYLDPHSRLWLTKTPMFLVRMREKVAIADLYNLDGEPLMSVELPMGISPYRPYFTVAENKALGVVEDELGRQTVLILEFQERWPPHAGHQEYPTLTSERRE
jgi:hypothetical protein